MSGWKHALRLMFYSNEVIQIFSHIYEETKLDYVIFENPNTVFIYLSTFSFSVFGRHSSFDR